MKQTFFYGLTKINMPIVALSCKGIPLLFLIDTGSASNHLLAPVHDYFKENYNDVVKDSKSGQTVTVTGITGAVECGISKFNFKIGRTDYTDIFLIMPTGTVLDEFSKQLDAPLCGILGGQFLCQNNVVLDYGNNCMYSKKKRKKKEEDKETEMGV